MSIMMMGGGGGGGGGGFLTDFGEYAYLHYDMEEADPDTRVDQVGNINLDTLISAPGRGTGKVGSYALAGAGATDYVYGTGANEAFDNVVKMTVNVWMKRTVWKSTNVSWFDIGQGGEQTNGVYFSLGGAGYVDWRAYVSGGYQRAYYLVNNGLLTNNTYAMFTVVIDMSISTPADKITLWVNGTIISTHETNYTGTGTSLGTLTSDRVTMGANDTGYAPMITGDLLDHVTVFKGIALSAAQITTLYNSGNGLAFTSY